MGSTWLAFFVYASLHRSLGLRHLVLMAILAPLTVLLVWLLARAQTPLVETLELIFTWSLGTVLLINVGSLLVEVGTALVASRFTPASIQGVTVPEKSMLPDVYLVVFDAFAGGESLKETFGYDNSEFVQEMDRRGFTYLPRSRSLYDFTICSIPATVSGRRVCHEVLGGGWSGAASYLMNRSVGDSQFLRLMKRAGYEFVSIASDPVMSFKSLGAEERHFVRRKYLHLLLDHSPLGFLQSPWLALGIRDVLAREWYPASIPWALDQIELAAGSTSSPKFVFAHIMSPTTAHRHLEAVNSMKR